MNSFQHRFITFLALLPFLLLKGGEVPSLKNLSIKRTREYIKSLKGEVFQNPHAFPHFQAFLGKITSDYLPSEIREDIGNLDLGLISQKFDWPSDIGSLSAQGDIVVVALKNGPTYSVNTRLGTFNYLPKHENAQAVLVDNNSLFTANSHEIKLSESLEASPYKKEIKGPIKRIQKVGKRLFFDNNEEVSIYEKQSSGSPLKKLRSIPVEAPGHLLTPDGSVCIQNVLEDKAGNPSTIRIKDAETNALLISDTLSPEKGKVTHMALSPQGKNAIAGTTEGQAFLYALKTGERTLVSRGRKHKQPGEITAAVITPQTKRIITGSSQGQVRIGHADKRASQLIQHRGGVVSVATTHDGSLLTTSGRDNKTNIFERGKDNNYILLEKYSTALTPQLIAFNNNERQQIAIAAGNQLHILHTSSSYIP